MWYRQGQKFPICSDIRVADKDLIRKGAPGSELGSLGVRLTAQNKQRGWQETEWGSKRQQKESWKNKYDSK